MKKKMTKCLIAVTIFLLFGFIVVLFIRYDKIYEEKMRDYFNAFFHETEREFLELAFWEEPLKETDEEYGIAYDEIYQMFFSLQSIAKEDIEKSSEIDSRDIINKKLYAYFYRVQNPDYYEVTLAENEHFICSFEFTDFKYNKNKAVLRYRYRVLIFNDKTGEIRGLGGYSYDNRDVCKMYLKKQDGRWIVDVNYDMIVMT